MRYRYTFDVVSRVSLPTPMEFVHRGFTFRVIDRDKRFTEIVVETPSVQLPPNWKRAPDPARSIPVFTVPPDPYLPAIQNEIRAIRGALTLWGVIDIDADQPDVEFIPENPVEHSELDMFSMNLKRQPRDQLPMIPPLPDMLVRCVLARNQFARYEIPLEFYRRGSDDCYHRQYVEAIFSFFFILEYLFGGGKFKTRQLETQFLASADLQIAITDAQKHTKIAARGEEWAKRATTKYGSATFDKIVTEIIDLRGFVHHQSLTRTGNWNPGTQGSFESDARFLQVVAQSTLMKAAVDILFAPEAMREFLSIPVIDQTGKPIPWQPRPSFDS